MVYIMLPNTLLHGDTLAHTTCRQTNHRQPSFGHTNELNKLGKYKMC